MILEFREVWCVDFEFATDPSGLPVPVCMVAREYRSGKLIRLFGEEMNIDRSPFDTGPDAMFVAYYASAEFGCFLSLGWTLPERVIDLYAEFRNLRSGLSVPGGFGLLGALTFYGLDPMNAVEKDELRVLAMRGFPYSDAERVALLDYCQEDVDSLAALMPRMLPEISSVGQALLRGRYMIAVSRMERAGIPIDRESLESLNASWDDLKLRLIDNVDRWSIWDGGSFRTENFARFLNDNHIAWPRTEGGRLALDDATFKSRGLVSADVEAIRSLRKTLAELRLSKLIVWEDGRARCMLSPFGSKTGRNQPSNSRFIFGFPAWARSLLKPAPGMAIAYLDYSQQEHGIAAKLSGDTAMIDAYESGDPYLAFAIQAGAVPIDATKESHPRKRSLFKECTLGVQYGMGSESLAWRIGESVDVAEALLKQHRETYPTFWAWSDAAEAYAMMHSSLHSVFGWLVHVPRDKVNSRSLRNFPMQANGAEMLRMACCLATERGISVCAPVHDALLIEAPVDEIDTAVVACQAAMCEASEIVLSGFPLRTDAYIVKYPDRYMDERGEDMWKLVMGLLDNPVEGGPELGP
jgi:DNA polymerase I